MASDSALAQHWEKIVLLAAVVILVGITAVFYGSYFSVKNPQDDIEKLGQKYRESVARPGAPIEPPELVGVSRFEAEIAGSQDTAPAHDWAFYNYMGVKFERREEVVERRFRLPRVQLTTRVDDTTGAVEISLQPDKVEQGDPEIPQQGMFTVEFYRYELAAGPGAAQMVQRSDRFVIDLMEEIGSTPAGSTATPLDPGQTYAYFVRMTINEDVLLVEGARRQADSESVLVTTPDRFRIVGHRRDSRKTFVTIAVTDESASRIDLRVSTSALKGGTPIETPENESTYGPYFPFRPLPNQAFAKELEYHDLQRSFFDMLFPLRTTAPGMGGGGGGGGGEGPPDEGGEGNDEETGGGGDAPPQRPAGDGSRGGIPGGR